MARDERFLLGSRAQILAAAYASVATRGHFVERFDLMLGKFTFTKFACGFLQFGVEVTVDEEDDTHSRVTVRTFRVGDGLRLERLARRIANRYLNRVQGEWVKPLRAYCEPGWYSDVTGRFQQRYWDGQVWTPWVWMRDSLLLDHPTGGGNWFTLHRENTWVTPQPVVVMTELYQRWLPPPLYGEERLWSRPQRWRFQTQLTVARHPKAFGAGGIVAFVAILILVGASLTPVRPDHGPPVATSRTEPIGLAIGTEGHGIGGATVQVRQVDQDKWAFGDPIKAYVLIEACAGKHPMRVGPDFVTVVGFDGGRHAAAESGRTPDLRSGYVKEHHCQRGWVTSPIGFGARTVEWHGDGWDTTRWAV